MSPAAGSGRLGRSCSTGAGGSGFEAVVDGVGGEVGAVRPADDAELVNADFGETGRIAQGLHHRAEEPVFVVEDSADAVMRRGERARSRRGRPRGDLRLAR